MPVELVDKAAPGSLPVHLVTAATLAGLALDGRMRRWIETTGFTGEAGRLLLLPGEDGALAGAIFAMPADMQGHAPLATGTLARQLPPGDWHFADAAPDPAKALLGLLLGGYAFTRYGRKPTPALRVVVPDGVDAAAVSRHADGVRLARDLINTPTSDMGPAQLEKAARELAAGHGAELSVTTGDDLLAAGFPMIHAVGRASAEAPRLIDMRWGSPAAPKVTLVGKGVCFDTGGLDIKPASNMLLMKKDMGGAAAVLGLAHMVMAARLPVRLRVLVPAVENAISGNAFRPGDVLRSRKGIHVEIGNTDAEGRLVLADALSLADEEEPELLIDMATLTGAARVALGPDLPALFTDDDALADGLARAGAEAADPLWRLPLWRGYDARLSSKVAEINNVTSDGFAGAITAALFLRRFVERAGSWAHFDIFGWNPLEKPHCPVGGEAQAIRAIERLLAGRYAS